jgi:DNA-binding transcriptional ArsR family regulator
VEAFDVLGDPVRRRVLELLANDELAAGQVVDAVREEFGISQPAVSQHLRVLRESGFAHVRVDGNRRLYSVNPERLDAVEEWIAGLRRAWEQRLDALGTELARGRRRRATRETQ